MALPFSSAGRLASGVSRRFREKRRRVMGGFGSGRRSGSGRDTVEACRSLDVNRLHRASCLHAGSIGSWQGEVLPWFDARKKELANRPLIRE
jgi:hypothetical protein